MKFVEGHGALHHPDKHLDMNLEKVEDWLNFNKPEILQMIAKVINPQQQDYAKHRLEIIEQELQHIKVQTENKNALELTQEMRTKLFSVFSDINKLLSDLDAITKM